MKERDDVEKRSATNMTAAQMGPMRFVSSSTAVPKQRRSPIQTPLHENLVCQKTCDAMYQGQFAATTSTANINTATTIITTSTFTAATTTLWAKSFLEGSCALMYSVTG